MASEAVLLVCSVRDVALEEEHTAKSWQNWMTNTNKLPPKGGQTLLVCQYPNLLPPWPYRSGTMKEHQSEDSLESGAQCKSRRGPQNERRLHEVIASFEMLSGGSFRNVQERAKTVQSS